MSNKLKKIRNQEAGITLTIGELLAANAAFVQVLLQLEFTFVDGYELNAMIGQLHPFIKAADDQRVAIGKKHQNDKGELPPERKAEYLYDITTLFAKTITLNVKRLPFSMFARAKGTILGHHTQALKPFIEKEGK